MAEFPMLPLWTDAYLGDTTHLSCTEHGAYLLLLITAWRSKTLDLPDDDVLLARYCRLRLDKWRRWIRPVVETYFVIEGGRWRSPRLLDEFQATLRRRVLLSQASAHGNRAKALKRQHRDTPDGSRVHSPPSPDPSPVVKEEEATASSSRKPPPAWARNGTSHGEKPEPPSEPKTAQPKPSPKPKARGRPQPQITVAANAAFQAYDQFAEACGWSTCMVVTDARIALMLDRLKQVGGVPEFRRVLERAATSDLLCGRVEPLPGKPVFRPDVNWFLNPDNFAKLLEGRFDNRKKSNGSNGHGKSGAVESDTLAGWSDRLAVYHGLTEAKPGTWLAKWGPKPGAEGNQITEAMYGELKRRHGVDPRQGRAA